MPRLEINRKLLPLLQKPKRFKVAIGGRGSGKSQGVADIQLLEAQTKGIKIGCFREYQNSIDDSVLSLLESEADRLEMSDFNIDRHFKFKGLARNVESIKSMHGFKRFWVEEAQTISKDSLKLLTPTLREAGAECWFTANLMSSADPFSERFYNPFEDALLKDGYYEDDLHLIVIVNWRDNPWFPENLNQERLWDLGNLSRAEYDHIWEGRFNDSVENSIILPEWFDAAIDAHVKLGFKPAGAKIVSHDPSDVGRDAKGLAYRHGSVVLDVQESDAGDVNDGCDWATDYAIEHAADLFMWDCDGLGVSLRRQVDKAFEGKKIDFQMFKGSESVDDPESIYQPAGHKQDAEKKRTNADTFRNKRAQYYWALRDRFFNTYRAIVKGEYVNPDDMISLSSNIKHLPKLRSEVCRIPKKPNGNGLIQIMTKEEMWTKFKIKSPNMADSLMISMRYKPHRSKRAPLSYPKTSIA